MLATILIIYQTALGRAFSRKKEAEISKLMETRECINTGNVELSDGQWRSTNAENSIERVQNNSSNI